jgi:hypothetical protein
LSYSPKISRYGARWIFFVGLLVGALSALDEVFNQFVLQLFHDLNVSSVWITYANFLLLPFLSFLLTPCSIFGIIYIWGRRSTTTKDFRENFPTLVLFMFFGTITGFTFSYFPLVILAGDTFIIPNLPSFIVGVLQYLQSIVSLTVSVVLTGIAALTIAYFRNEHIVRFEDHKEKMPELLPQEYKSPQLTSQ